MQYKRGMQVLILLEVVALLLICGAAFLRLTKKAVDDKKNKKTTTTESVENTVDMTLDDMIATDADAEESQEVEVEVDEMAFSQELLDKVEAMSTEDKVAQLFAVTPEIITDESQVTYVGDITRDAVDRYHVASFVFSDWNYESEEQMTKLLQDVQSLGEELTDSKLLVLGRDDRGENEEFFYQIGDVKKLAAAIGSGETLVGAAGVTQIIDDVAAVTKDTDCMLLRDTVDATYIAALRQEKTYNHVVMTELSEKEIDGDYYETSEYAVYAVKNGVDMLYADQSFEASYAAVLDAVNAGEIDKKTLDKAVARVLTFKNKVN